MQQQPVNYIIQNMQHLFTFLAPRNLNRTALELFFSLISGWASDRLVGVLDNAVVKTQKCLARIEISKITVCKLK